MGFLKNFSEPFAFALALWPFDARIVAKHIRVAFEAPRAHDDASLRTVRFAARHNARHFAR